MSLCEAMLLKRNIVGILSFLGFINAFMCRINLSVAIIDMTTNKTKVNEDGTVTYSIEYPWDPQQKGLALSSFYYGYIVTQIPGGWLSAKVGGASVFCAGLAINSILVSLLPMAATLSYNWFIALRILQGASQGVMYSSIQAHWARWAPPAEKTRLVSLTYSGCFIGCAIAFPLCGIIIQYLNWKYTFYITGVSCFIWCVIWFALVSNDPSTDRFISQSEQEYLMQTISTPRKPPPFPWSKALLSMPLWAITLTYFCSNWGFYTSITQLPTFLSDVYGFEIGKVGVLSSFAYLLMGSCLLISGILSDVLRRERILTTTQTRKTFNTVAFIIQAVFMVISAFSVNVTVAIVSLTIALGAGGVAWSAFSVNPQDIAPQYASIIYGIANMFSTFSGIIGPHLAGIIASNKSAAEWRTVFLIISVFYVIGCINYLIFASGERQPWAQDKQEVERTVDSLKH